MFYSCNLIVRLVTNVACFVIIFQQLYSSCACKYRLQFYTITNGDGKIICQIDYIYFSHIFFHITRLLSQQPKSQTWSNLGPIDLFLNDIGLIFDRGEISFIHWTPTFTITWKVTNLIQESALNSHPHSSEFPLLLTVSLNVFFLVPVNPPPPQ